MKCQSLFSGNNKKNINLSSVQFAQRMVKVINNFDDVSYQNNQNTDFLLKVIYKVFIMVLTGYYQMIVTPERR